MNTNSPKNPQFTCLKSRRIESVHCCSQTQLIMVSEDQHHGGWTRAPANTCIALHRWHIPVPPTGGTWAHAPGRVGIPAHTPTNSSSAPELQSSCLTSTHGLLWLIWEYSHSYANQLKNHAAGEIFCCCCCFSSEKSGSPAVSFLGFQNGGFVSISGSSWYQSINCHIYMKISKESWTIIIVIKCQLCAC